jgi:cell shape-determining protein MreC
MKVSLRPINRPKYRKRVRLVVFLVGLILCAWLVPKLISQVAEIILYPVHATNTWFRESTSLVPTLIRSKQSLEEEIKQLKNQVIVAERSGVTQQRLLEENQRLRNLLGSDSESRVAATVIARPNDLPYDLLQIDRGSKHGIEVGAPVFVGNDVVVGLVVHVASEYSFVELFTAPDFSATTFVSGPNVVAVLEGLGGGVARVRLPQGVPLSVDDMVYLPSIEPGVFGRVVHVENAPTQPEQFGYITPVLSVSSMFYVSVGRLSQIARSATEIDEQIREIIKKDLIIKDLPLGSFGSTSTSTVLSEMENLTPDEVEVEVETNTITPNLIQAND